MRHTILSAALAALALAGPSVTAAAPAFAWPASTSTADPPTDPAKGAVFVTQPQDVTAVSRTSAWSVGAAFGQGHGGLIQHWDGSSWKTVLDDLRRGDNGEVLDGVAGDSDTDVWAVGTAVNPQRNQYGVILHWDGSSWRRITSATLHLGINTHLNDVAELSPTDVWITGWVDRVSNGLAAPLALHWNGSSLQRVDLPYPHGNPTTLDSVSAASGSDIWATVTVGDPTNPNLWWSMVEHWDGQSWHRTTPAKPPWKPAGLRVSNLAGIAAVAPGEAWVVGADGANHPLVEHYANGRWTRVTTPRAPSGSDYLDDVSGTSDSDIWVVGYNVPTRGNITTMTMHWDGHTWTRIPSPNLPPGPQMDPATLESPRAPGDDMLRNPFAPVSLLEVVFDSGPGRTWATGEWERYSPEHGLKIVPLTLQWTGHTWVSR